MSKSQQRRLKIQMKLSEDILDAVKGEYYSVTIDLYTGWADKAAQLEAENEKLKWAVDYIWQEIYEADKPELSVRSVEILRALKEGE